jgi:hypothetical protein
MQETQKPNKEIERLEDESSTLGLLVTTVEKGKMSLVKGFISIQETGSDPPIRWKV